jgi:FSR family fosmidomycin resistance protein-like MFS transporter
MVDGSDYGCTRQRAGPRVRRGGREIELTTTTHPNSAAQGTTFAIIFAVALCHGINDIMQSLLTAIYPILKTNYGLDYVQLGILTLVFQCTASLLQPAIGIYTDKKPLPYSIAAGMAFTLVGLVVLGFAHDYWLLLVGSALIGFGSAVFHPESSRVARLASGGRHGFAQSTFQVGGNTGQAIGPLLAAFVVLPHGQSSIAWFAVAALCGMLILSWVGRWYAEHMRAASKRPAASTALPFDRRTTIIALSVLTLLTFTKNIYMAGVGNYFTFYLIHKFNVDVQTSQLILFLFLGASAVGVFLGGPIGDRYGAKFVIWLSILGALPFALALPYADFTWTIILSIVIGIVFSSCFSAIVVFAQELMPGRIGMIAGIFFGLAFGAGGIAAAALGALADVKGIDFVFQVTSYLPLLGVLTVFLPSFEKTRVAG